MSMRPGTRYLPVPSITRAWSEIEVFAASAISAILPSRTTTVLSSRITSRYIGMTFTWVMTQTVSLCPATVACGVANEKLAIMAT